MPVSINGNTGVVTGLAVGGLPDGIVDADMLASNAVTATKLASGVGGKVLQVVVQPLVFQRQTPRKSLRILPLDY